MKKCGLITEKGHLVPLKDVSVEITITGFVAHVVSSLQYENNEENPVEAEFTFPLDDGSAVYNFEAFIEDRHIVAECQEKEEARKTYNEAIEAGNTAMLLEEDDTAGDIFRCLVGNLPPKTVAKLVIGYVIELPVEHDGKLRFTLPVILNPRYSPNVGGLESAKGATYVLKQKDIPYSFKLSASVEGTKPVKSVTASQPHIEINYGEDKKTAKVSFTDDFTFDADVRLFVEYENTYEPECLVENGNKEKSGFLSEDVLMINLFPDIDTATPTNKGEYIFVLDRSGSMGFGANRIKHAKEALLLFLKSLPVGCYFNIVSFGSTHSFLFTNGSEAYTENSLKKALSELKNMDANMGGTEILAPLESIYKKPTIKDQPRQIFLLTDGEVGNVQDVIQIVRKNSTNTRVFTIGIGEGASTALVNGAARAGNGKAEFIKDSERMQPKVVALLKFAMQPSITDVKIEWDLPSMVTATTVPETPSCLFDGDRLILYALLQGFTESHLSGKVYINGSSDKGPMNFSANFFYDKSADVSSVAPLHRLAAKAQIKLLEDQDDYSETKKKEIVAVSVASNMISKYTSFVAIDKERKEKVEGKHVRRNVPVMADMMSQNLQFCLRKSASVARPIQVGRGLIKRKQRRSKAAPSRRSAPVMASASMDRGMPLADCLDESYDDDISVVQTGDKMMDMISMQSFQGNWVLNGDVCRALNVDVKVLKGLKMSEKDDIVATLAVLVWLELNYKGRHDEWEMIENKALTWLKAGNLDDQTIKEKMKSIHDALASSMKI